MKVLEFDAGNTRLKWRLLDVNDSGTERVAGGCLTNDQCWQQELPQLLARLGAVDCARAATVSGTERFEWLHAAVASELGIPLQRAQVKPDWRGLQVAYPELGVDRWLAMLAAAELGGAENKLVVSCGTAVTIDALSYTGRHLGGYIVPGVSLMKRSLHANTAQLPQVADIGSAIVPGVSTVDCINNGALAMVAAMINARLADAFDLAENKECVVYITGGDAVLIKPFIRGVLRDCSELVMDGLSLAF